MGREPSVIALPDGIETPERQLRVLLKHVVPHGSGNSARKRSVIRSLARSGRHAEPRTVERVVSLWAMRPPSSNAASWHAVEFACGVIPMDAAIALGTAMATVALSDRMATPSPITCMTALCPTFRPRGADHRDDLGSEFRYRGGPIPPLKALDQASQVIYIGAFSMTLLQSLRVGYMIMPRALAERCRRLIQVRYGRCRSSPNRSLPRLSRPTHPIRVSRITPKSPSSLAGARACEDRLGKRLGGTRGLAAGMGDVEHVLERHALGGEQPQATVAYPFVGVVVGQEADIGAGGSNSSVPSMCGVAAAQWKFTPQIVSVSM
jgi:hypothetical protein